MLLSSIFSPFLSIVRLWSGVTQPLDRHDFFTQVESFSDESTPQLHACSIVKFTSVCVPSHLLTVSAIRLPVRFALHSVLTQIQTYCVQLYLWKFFIRNNPFRCTILFSRGGPKQQ